MTLYPPRPHRRPLARVLRAGAVATIVLAAAACSGGDDTGGEAVPTLLTAPIQTASTSTTSSTSPTVTSTDLGTSTTLPTTTASSSTTVLDSTTTGDAGAPSGPGASTETTPSTPAPTAASDAGASSTAPPASATSSTADIEPPDPTIASTVPIPTVAQPPGTVGGSDPDYLLAPRAIAGLQFGASRTTVLNRMRTLLGDPTRVTELTECRGGPATALQWFNASVIVTDRGLSHYIVGMDFDSYGEAEVPGWHTAAGLQVGGDQAQLEAVYPGQITYGPATGTSTPFTLTSGADAGIGGRLTNGVLQSVSAGPTTC